MSSLRPVPRGAPDGAAALTSRLWISASISLNPSTSVPTSSLLLRSTWIVYDFSVVTVLAAAASRRIGREMNPCRIQATTNAMTVEPARTIATISLKWRTRACCCERSVSR